MSFLRKVPAGGLYAERVNFWNDTILLTCALVRQREPPEREHKMTRSYLLVSTSH